MFVFLFKKKKKKALSKKHTYYLDYCKEADQNMHYISIIFTEAFLILHFLADIFFCREN